MTRFRTPMANAVPPVRHGIGTADGPAHGDPVDGESYRRALTRLTMAVSVVTTLREDGEPYGVTIGSLAALSLRPPLVLFNLDAGSSAAPVFAAAPTFLAHVLKEDQQDTARTFTTSHALPGESRDPRHGGLPLVPGALVVLACRRRQVVAAGDHVIVIGEVEHVRVDQGGPLVYYEHCYYGLPLS